MKKTVALLLILASILTLVSCTKNNVETTGNETAKAVSDNEQSVLNTEKTPESTSEQTKSPETTAVPLGTSSPETTLAPATESKSPETTSAPATESKSPETTSAPATEPNTPETTKAPATTVAVTTSSPVVETTGQPIQPPSPPLDSGKITFRVDQNREKSVDIGSCVENGYIYYESPTDVPPGIRPILRKSLSGGDPETVIESGGNSFRVLKGKIYYLSNNGLYKRDVDGKNEELIHTDNYLWAIEVADNWIFAVRNVNGEDFTLLMISIDGKQIKEISCGYNGQGYHRNRSLYIFGFNRGYCYYAYFCNHVEANLGHFESIIQRIDYRTATPVPENVETVFPYYSNGQAHNWWLESPPWVYRHTMGKKMLTDNVFTFYDVEGYRIISLSDSNQIALYSKKSSSAPWANIKDYFVYLEYGTETKFAGSRSIRVVCDISLTFIDTSGNTKKVLIPLASDELYETCSISPYQDIYGNNLVLLLRSPNTNMYKMLMVGPDGSINEIYNIK